MPTVAEGNEFNDGSEPKDFVALEVDDFDLLGVVDDLLRCVLCPDAAELPRGVCIPVSKLKHLFNISIKL